MASNSFGLIYRFTTWGESHGEAIGVVLDGVPSNFKLDLEMVQGELDRRRPGQSKLVSARKEPDQVEVLSGLYEGKTTGAPISFLIRNKDQRSKDYSEVRRLIRPGHADYTYYQKYHNFDPNGGGRSSARETAGRVIAGAVAKQFLALHGVTVQARLVQVGAVVDDTDAMETLILKTKQAGDSIGGKIEIVASGVPAGIGDPHYEKLDARLAFALMSIHAVKAVEIGEGVDVVTMQGSENNDILTSEGFQSNHAGGVLGGISTGQDIIARISIKPTASIFKEQATVDYEGKDATLNLRGRHDPCVALRAPVIAEAMVAQVIFDLGLQAGCLSPIKE